MGRIGIEHDTGVRAELDLPSRQGRQVTLKDDDDLLGSRPFVDRIHHLTDGLTGETYRLIGKLRMLAVQHDGQSLQEEWLGKVDWTAPSDRRNRSTTG